MTKPTLAGVIIREETNYDIGGVRIVHESAFDTPAEADLVDLLRERGKATISLVAEIDGEIVGHILFSPVTIEPPQPGWNALGLAPVAVIPDRQGRGIGQALVDLRAALYLLAHSRTGMVKCAFRPKLALGLEL